ncbi:MAG: YciI family protein [Desulfobacterales bacterium]
MQFLMMMIPKAYQADARSGESVEEGYAPPAEAVVKMMKFNEEMEKAGVLIALDGLYPSSRGARVMFVDGKSEAIDGPFTQAKEIVGGYWIIQTRSKEEAVEWAKRCPASDGDIIEIREVFEGSDLSPAIQKTVDILCCACRLKRERARDAH